MEGTRFGGRRGYPLESGVLAGVVELADTQDLGSCAARREGSSPFSGTDEQRDFADCITRWCSNLADPVC